MENGAGYRLGVFQRAHRSIFAAMFVLSLLLLLGVGCGRKPQTDSKTVTGTNSPSTSLHASGNNSENIGKNRETNHDSTHASLSKTTNNINFSRYWGSDQKKSKALEMVLIPSGSFQMGDQDVENAPLHEVTISSFYLDKYLVTQEHYSKVMGVNPSRWKGGQNPVEQVRWPDAAEYCNKRSSLEGLTPCYNTTNWQCDFEASGYRLPTEAEWEYACRAGTRTPYYFGSTSVKLANYAWFKMNSDGHPHPVGQKEANPWGLFDMTGNVWQWCNDFYKADYYRESMPFDPSGPASGNAKVVRGGAFRFSEETCRSGYRSSENPGFNEVCYGYDIYGFRCARKMEPQKSQ